MYLYKPFRLRDFWLVAPASQRLMATQVLALVLNRCQLHWTTIEPSMMDAEVICLGTY